MTTAPSGLRLFVAAEVTDAVRSACASLRERFGSAIHGARWTPPEGVHLTLKFLGSVPEARIALITETLTTCGSLSHAFTVTTGGPGLFGDPRRPRVLWVAIEGDTAPAAELAMRLEDAFARIKFEKESRPFRLHLTLARFDPRAGARIPALLLDTVSKEMAGLPIRVEDIVLFQSRPGAGGSSYTPLRRVPLQGGSAA